MNADKLKEIISNLPRLLEELGAPPKVVAKTITAVTVIVELIVSDEQEPKVIITKQEYERLCALEGELARKRELIGQLCDEYLKLKLLTQKIESEKIPEDGGGQEGV